MIGAVATPVPAKFLEDDGSDFSWEAPVLWQDASPEVPLRKLMTQQARNLVSIARLYFHYRRTRETTKDSTGQHTRIPSYEHVAGMMQMPGRHPAKDAGLYGIIVCKEDAEA